MYVFTCDVCCAKHRFAIAILFIYLSVCLSACLTVCHTHRQCQNVYSIGSVILLFFAQYLLILLKQKCSYYDLSNNVITVTVTKNV